VIAARLWWHSHKLGADDSFVCIGRGVRSVAIWPPVPPPQMKWPVLGVLLLRDGDGRAGLYDAGWGGDDFVLGRGESHRSRAAYALQLVTNPSLPTVPLFTLAGYFSRKAAHRSDWCVCSTRCSG